MTMHTLYRFYNDVGVLLYVGITINPGARLTKHKDTKTWWQDVARVDLEHYPDRTELLSAERQAIETEKPLHNIRMNGSNASRLEWPCDICGEKVEDGEGYLTVSYRDIAQWEQWHEEFDRSRRERAQGGITFYCVSDLNDMPPRAAWKVLHRRCDPEPASSDYWYEIGRIRTPADVFARTAHLMGKRWINSTDWQNVLWRLEAVA